MKVFITEAARTPFGSYFGSLSAIRPDDLLGATIKELVKKVSSLDPQEIDDVIMGDSNGAGEDNRNVARMSALLAGLPETVPGVTVNRLCGSGAEAVIQASRAVKTGDAKFVIAGGVEAMSRAPWIVRRTGKKLPESVSVEELNQSTVGWQSTFSKRVDGKSWSMCRESRRTPWYLTREPRSMGASFPSTRTRSMGAGLPRWLRLSFWWSSSR
jgi:acetyl-CoA acetyltransferase